MAAGCPVLPDVNIGLAWTMAGLPNALGKQCKHGEGIAASSPLYPGDNPASCCQSSPSIAKNKFHDSSKCQGDWGMWFLAGQSLLSNKSPLGVANHEVWAISKYLCYLVINSLKNPGTPVTNHPSRQPENPAGLSRKELVGVEKIPEERGCRTSLTGESSMCLGHQPNQFVKKVLTLWQSDLEYGL